MNTTRDLSLRRGSETDKKLQNICRELHIEDTEAISRAVSLLEELVALRAHKDTRDLCIYDRTTGSLIKTIEV